MLTLVIYDIADSKVRFELANYLKTKGFVRVQRSFFIGRPPPNVLLDVERTLHRFVRSPRDVIHVVHVPEAAVRNIKVYGKPLAELSTVKRLLVIT